MAWTLFWDMHSGGGTKEPPYEKIYIEAPEEEAISVFYSKFDHNPLRVSCTCCGEDYSISESKTLEEASAYHRNSEWDKKIKGYKDTEESTALEDYIKQKEVKVIYENEINSDERTVNVPEEGFVWV